MLKSLLLWYAFHDGAHHAVIPLATSNALLFMFLDSAHSVAMICHSMDIIKAAVQHLNPGEIPVLAADQPPYPLAKEVQWTWPDTYGEDHFMIMLGGLHIEMVILKFLRDWMEDSGWTNALIQADIASSGTAKSFIHPSHVTKTRNAHHVTDASLYTLFQQGYSEDCTPDETDAMQPNSSPFEERCVQRAKVSFHFHYWLKTLLFKLLLPWYIRSVLESNFHLYVESLTQIMPWMFALDHTHCSQ